MIRLAARSGGMRKTRSGISGSRGEPALDEDEEAEHRHAERASGHEHAGAAPAERVGADDAVDEARSVRR